MGAGRGIGEIESTGGVQVFRVYQCRTIAYRFPLFHSTINFIVD